jgi:hypothetical protein
MVRGGVHLVTGVRELLSFIVDDRVLLIRCLTSMGKIFAPGVSPVLGRGVHLVSVRSLLVSHAGPIGSGYWP